MYNCKLIMKFSNYVLFSFFLSVLFSCVTPSELGYLDVSQDVQSLSKFSYDYKVKSGDLISVQIKTITPIEFDFFNQAKESNTQLFVSNPYLYGYVVNDEGFLDLPIIGSFEVVGKNLNEVSLMIKERSKSYFKDPSVKVNILNFYVTVLGEVNKPGRINVIEPQTTLLEIIGLAGDLKEYANRKRIKIIRISGEKPVIYYVNLKDLDVVASSMFYLQPDDVIYIEPLQKKFFGLNDITSTLSFAISSYTLYYLLNQ